MKSKAVIFDLDMTLFNRYPGRGPYDWSTCEHDTPREYVVNLLKYYHSSGYQIILLTGREESAREGSLKCLSKWDIPHHHLFMRQNEDRRSGDIVKEEIYLSKIAPHYDIEAAFEDSPKIVAMWINNGLDVFVVNNPRYD